MVLFAMNRIGFRVDAAIVGFAIGTGFSMAENAYLLHVLTQANITVWIFRGFGTAMMHGGTTAIFAVMAQTLIEKRPKLGPLDLLPGSGRGNLPALRLQLLSAPGPAQHGRVVHRAAGDPPDDLRQERGTDAHLAAQRL